MNARDFLPRKLSGSASPPVRTAAAAQPLSRGAVPGVNFSDIPIHAPSRTTEEARNEAGGLCLRGLFPLGGRVRWAGLSQALLDAEVRVKDEHKATLKRAAAGTTQYDVDAVYFNDDRARQVIKVPDHCTIEYEGDLDGYVACCNAAGIAYESTFGSGETYPRPGTAAEFGVPNTPEEWEKAK